MEKFIEKFNIKDEEKEQMNDSSKSIVPETEISEQFSRSSGKGGQNVNKLATKAEVRWNIDESLAFSEEEKEKIKRYLANRINKEGELIVISQKERSQFLNRKRAKEQLNDLVRLALEAEKERIPTQPSRLSKERRLEEKKRQSEKKKWRATKVEIEN